LTIEHIYKSSKPGIKKKVKINRGLFGRIIKLYLKKAFERVIIDKREVNLPQNFGKIFLAKILCTRFNPMRYRRHVDIDSYDGYFHFVAWDRNLKLRSSKMKIARKWKNIIAKDMERGGDCIDITNIVNE